MNEKGFTLAEVMGVIVLLAAIALIIIPIVDKQIKEGNKELYNSAIDSIESSLGLYMSDIDLGENESMIITLYQLKQAGFVDNNFKNPVNGEFFPNDMIITIKNNNGSLEYDINTESGNNKTDYESTPKMVLNGNSLEYVELGDNYLASSNDVISTYGSTTLETIVESNVDLSKVGIYRVKYTTNYRNISNEIYKTVIIRDTKGPKVGFDDLYIPLSEASSYDYKSDITTYDASGIKNIEVETNFGALTGLYSVKYTVIDNFDNKTVKYRKVITN